MKEYIKEIIGGFFVLLSIILTWMLNRKSSKKPDFTDRQFKMVLTEHPLFNTLEKYSNACKYTTYINEYKTLIGRDMLEIKYQSGLTRFKKFAEQIEKEHTELSISELKSLVTTTIYETIADYSNKWITMGVPLLLVDKFNHYHNKNAKCALEHMEVDFQDNYMSIYEMAWHVLGHIQLAYDSCHRDAKIVINGINGELKGHSYKGMLNDCRHVLYNGIMY